MLLPINTGQRGKLFKSGGSTQFTEGGYSELRQVVIVKGLDLHGREAPFSSFQHSIASFGNTVFAYPGDRLFTHSSEKWLVSSFEVGSA